MSYFYVKNGEPWVPEAINPDLVKLAKAIVKTCRLTFKHQMKVTALQNVLKNDDKAVLLSTMQKCMEKNKTLYNQDMSLTGAKIEEIGEEFFADKDTEFLKNQIKILIDFAAINTVVESRMMPLMSEACQKTLNKPINMLYFFTNQDEILHEEEAQEEE